MGTLLDEVLAAHGGLARWKARSELTVHTRIGGTMWARKGQGGILADSQARVALHDQHVTYTPFGTAGQRSVYTPDVVRIETVEGRVLAERHAPRAAFDEHDSASQWDTLHTAYFSGYALWNYLTVPFLFAYPGVQAEEIEPWLERGEWIHSTEETWRRLSVRFPPSIATHNTQQTFYFDMEGLLRRHDYAADVFGGMPTAHYVDAYQTFGGFLFPTRRRVVPRRLDNTTLAGPLLVTIDLEDLHIW